MAEPAYKKTKTDDRCVPNRQDVGLIDLLINGGRSVSSSLMQDLAIQLLYAPRPMEDLAKIVVPSYSAYVSCQTMQLGRLLIDGDIDQSDLADRYVFDTASNLCQSAEQTFYRQNHKPIPRPTYDRLEDDRTCRRAWQKAAVETINRLHGSSDYNGIKLAGPLRYAPFWIDFEGSVVSAYALGWTGPRWPTLEFAAELYTNCFYRMTFPAKPQDNDPSGRPGCIITAYNGEQPDYDENLNLVYPTDIIVEFDRHRRDETAYSTAMAALDGRTGRMAGLTIIGSAIDGFPDDLSAIVVRYVMLPPIPVGLLDWLATQERLPVDIGRSVLPSGRTGKRHTDIIY